jgi:hypothetical protein
MQIFEMFGGMHNRQFIEKVYLDNGKEMELVLEMFLSGNIPKEEQDLEVIIEKEEKKENTTYNQIQ